MAVTSKVTSKRANINMDDDRQLIPRSSHGIVDPHADADYGEGDFFSVDEMSPTS